MKARQLSRADRRAIVEFMNPALPIFRQCRSWQTHPPSRRTHGDRSRYRNRQGYTLRSGPGCPTFGVHLRVRVALLDIRPRQSLAYRLLEELVPSLRLVKPGAATDLLFQVNRPVSSGVL